MSSGILGIFYAEYISNCSTWVYQKKDSWGEFLDPCPQIPQKTLIAFFDKCSCYKFKTTSLAPPSESPCASEQ